MSELLRFPIGPVSFYDNTRQFNGSAAPYVAEWVDATREGGGIATASQTARFGKAIKETLTAGAPPEAVLGAVHKCVERNLGPSLFPQVVNEVLTGRGGRKTFARQAVEEAQAQRNALLARPGVNEHLTNWSRAKRGLPPA